MKKAVMVITIVLAGLSLVFGQEQSLAEAGLMYKTCAQHSITPDKCNPKTYGQLLAQEHDQAPVEVKTAEVQVPVVNVQDAAAMEEQYRTCAHHFIPADKCKVS